MASWLIALTGLIYLFVSIDLAMRGRWELALAYAGYSVSNIGLFYAAKG